MKHKHIYVTFFLLFYFFHGIAYSQKILQIKTTGTNIYDVSCEMSFPNNVCSKLMDYCWDMKNISKLMVDESVKINYSEHASTQSVSYEYRFFVFRYYAKYLRERSTENGKIRFKLEANESDVPFVPCIKTEHGEYLFTSDGQTTKVHYIQHTECDGKISELYLDHIHNDIDRYFTRFELEAKKAIYSENPKQ